MKDTQMSKEQRRAKHEKHMKQVQHQKLMKQQQKAKQAKEREKESRRKENERNRIQKEQEKIVRARKHEQLMREQRKRTEEKKKKQAINQRKHVANSTEAQGHAIERRRCEVELSFDASTLGDTLREMLSKHGEIESMKPNIKGGLDIRFTTAKAAKSLLRSKKDNHITAQVSFPVTPVVIKQHCLYYKPEAWIIDQDVLNATAEYFSSISQVQQVKKMRNAVLIVFEDEETRDQMVKRSRTSRWKILGRNIGPCEPGLPPAVNKRKPRAPPQKKKKKKGKANGRRAAA